MKTYNIVLAADEKYLPYAAVTINSILMARRESIFFNFHILVDCIPPLEIQSKFNNQQGGNHHKVSFIEASAGAFAAVKTTEGISEATFYRLNMHRLLPDVDKALYLDCDLVCFECPSYLLDLEMGQNIFMGAQDTLSKRYNRKFRLKWRSKNVNAGVLLANLKQMRLENFEATCKNYVHKRGKHIFLGDQQIINVCAAGRIGHFPFRWNVHGSVYEYGWIENVSSKKNYYSLSELIDATQRPAILHFSYREKPWSGNAHPQNDKWHDFVSGVEFDMKNYSRIK